MALSLTPQQRPDQRMHTLSIEEILSIGKSFEGKQPPLEHYFSPTRKEMFIKDYLHFLNSSLLEVKHHNLNLDLYTVLVLSFQFVAPLLKISAEKELGIFYKALEEKYNMDDPDLNVRFAHERPGDNDSDEKDTKKSVLNEEDALKTFRNELDQSYEGRREVKESVQKRLKQDGIEAIMNWQHSKELPELAEAFGRSIVIPALFSFSDKKLVSFYHSSTAGISYEMEVPFFE